MFDGTNVTSVFRYYTYHILSVHINRAVHIWYYYLGEEWEFLQHGQPTVSGLSYIASDDLFLVNIMTRSDRHIEGNRHINSGNNGIK